MSMLAPVSARKTFWTGKNVPGVMLISKTIATSMVPLVEKCQILLYSGSSLYEISWQDLIYFLLRLLKIY